MLGQFLSEVGTVEKETDDDRREFTPHERAEIRGLVVAERRRRWLRETAGIWLKWLFWVSAGVVSIKLALTEVFSSMFK